MYQVSFQLKIFWTTHIKSFLHNSKHQDRVFFPLIMSKMTQNAKLFSSGGSCKLFKNILKKTKKKKKRLHSAPYRYIESTALLIVYGLYNDYLSCC